jgi:hypothetical protein
MAGMEYGGAPQQFGQEFMAGGGIQGPVPATTGSGAWALTAARTKHRLSDR